MAEKSALFISIARRCVSRGETGRAVVTIVNALRNNPDYMDAYPEAISLLAEILELRFAEEVHRLESRYPAFGPKLIEALVACGRAAFARDFEQSFSDYCIDRMKDVHVLNSREICKDVHVLNSRENCVDISLTSQSQMQYEMPAARQYVSQPVVVAAQDCGSAYDWMMAAAQDEQVHEVARHERRRESGELVRSFGRIRTQNDERPVAAEYADNAANRVIIDFDNSVNTTPKTAMFASGVTKIRTFAEELAAYQNQSDNKREYTILTSEPMERLAETTHQLSETPSVEPYSVRHPIRFKLTTPHIITCVLLCGCVVLALVSWRTATPYFEQRALQDVSENYILSAESGETHPLKDLDTSHVPFVDSEWIRGYKMFLEVWQNEHFIGDDTYVIHPDSEEFPGDYSSAQAAYLTQEIFANRSQQARQYYESLPSQIWREHPYFHLWVQAMFDEAERDFHAASYKYEKLLRTPLAPFALAQMGLMALDMNQSQNEIAERFLRNCAQMSMVSMIASCARSMLMHGADAVDIPSVAHLRQPYLQYCAIGKLSHEIHHRQIQSYPEYQLIKNAQPLPRGEYYRLETVVGAALMLENTNEAVDFYKTLELPEDHPIRIRLKNDIFTSDMWRGNWSGIRAMYPGIPKDIGYLAAARVIDEGRAGHAIHPALIQTPENLLKYRASGTSNGIVIDEAYAEAYAGHWERAIAITRALLTSHPDDYEPLFLQAHILSQSGRATEAAGILEQAMLTGRAGAPFVVLSNLYRVRGGLKPNASAFILDWVVFDDPLLESARCEIYWRTHSTQASACLQNLLENHQTLSKSAWMMLAINGNIKSDSAKWAKAGAGYMSTPGYYLAYARVLLKEDQFKAAIANYTHAILDDFSTAVPDTVTELEQIYTKRKRRIEGSHTFEELTEKAEAKTHDAMLLGTLHMAAARLYQPQTAHPMARKHLTRALELIGDNPDTLKGLVDYYEAKDKPEQARKYRIRLNRLLHDNNSN